jgi:hypothetical protein
MACKGHDGAQRRHGPCPAMTAPSTPTETAGRGGRPGRGHWRRQGSEGAQAPDPVGGLCPGASSPFRGEVRFSRARRDGGNRTSPLTEDARAAGVVGRGRSAPLFLLRERPPRAATPGPPVQGGGRGWSRALRPRVARGACAGCRTASGGADRRRRANKKPQAGAWGFLRVCASRNVYTV